MTIDKLWILKRNNFAILDNVQMMDCETQRKEIMEFEYADGRTPDILITMCGAGLKSDH